VDRFDTGGLIDRPAGAVPGHRWGSDEELRGGARSGVIPPDFGDLLGEPKASRWDGVTRVVS
jgi:hypothetical protein